MDINKKWIIIFIIIILVFSSIIIYRYYNSELNIYKRQSISILNQYKNGLLTNKETSKKIEEISKRIDNKDDSKNKYENSALFALKMKLSRIAQELLFNELSNTNINSHIADIKKI